MGLSDEYGDEYDESCWECGFNQKDQDEREKREKQELISEFVEDLAIIEEIDWDKYWKKFFDIQKKWEEKLK